MTFDLYKAVRENEGARNRDIIALLTEGNVAAVSELISLFRQADPSLFTAKTK